MSHLALDKLQFLAIRQLAKGVRIDHANRHAERLQCPDAQMEHALQARRIQAVMRTRIRDNGDAEERRNTQLECR